MTSPTSTTADAPITLKSPPAWVVQISRPGQPETTMPLPEGKCTIGSSSRCQIRLESSQVRPLHCLIVHESGGTVVTRWAPGALLNGQEFSTSPLMVRDCLQVADVKLTILANEETPVKLPSNPIVDSLPSQSMSTQRSSPFPPAEALHSLEGVSKPEKRASQPRDTVRTPVLKPAVETSTRVALPERNKSSDPASALHQIDRLVNQLTEAKHGARQRCRKLIAALREANAQSGSFGKQIELLQTQLRAALVERDEHAGRILQLQAEFEQQQRETAEETDRLIAEINQSYDQASEAEAQLNEQRTRQDALYAEIHQLKETREELEKSQTAGELQRTKLAQTLSDYQRTIEQLQKDLDEARTATSDAYVQSASQASRGEQLQLELDSLQVEYDALSTSQTESAQQLQEIQQKLSERERQVEELTEKISSAQAASAMMSEELARLASDREQDSAEIARLRAEHAEFDVAADESARQLHESEQAVDECHQRIDQLVAELSSVEEARSAAAHELAEQTTERDRVQSQLDDLQKQHMEVIAKSDDTSKRLREQDKTLIEREQQIAELAAEVSEWKRLADETSTKISETERHSEHLQQELDQLRTEHQQVLDEHQSLAEQYQQAQMAADDRSRMLQELTDQLEQAHATVEETKKQLAQEAENCQQFRAQLKRLENERSQLVSTRTEHQLKYQETEQAIADRERRVDLLNAKLEEQRLAIEEAERCAAEQTALRESLELRLLEQQQEYDQLVSAHETLKQEQDRWESSLAERDQQVSKLRKEYEEICGVLQTVEEGAFEQVDECRRLEAELAELRAEQESWNDIEAKCEARVQQLEQIAEKHQQEATTREEQLAAANNRRAELDRELASRTEACEALELEIADLNQRCEHLSTEHSSSQQQQQELQRILEEYRGRIDQLDRELLSANRQREELEHAVGERTNGHEKIQDELNGLRSEYEVALEHHTVELHRRKQVEAELLDQRKKVELFEADIQSLRLELTESTDRVQQIKAERGEAQAEIKLLEERLNAKETLLDQQDHGEEQLRKQSEELASELARVQKELSETSAQLEYARQSLESKNQAFEVDQAQVASESNDSESNNVEEASQAAELRSKVDYFSAPPNPEESDDNQSGEEFKPTSFIEQYSHMLEENNPLASEASAPVATSPEPIASLPVASDPSDESDDAALEAYMANMLQRMRGESPAAEAPPKVEQTSNQAPSVVSEVSGAEPQPQAANEVVAPSEPIEPFDLEALRNSSKKPELSVDLTAMRELANSSARSAIAKHHKRRHLERAVVSFIVCLIAIAVGLYMLLTANSIGSWNFIGGCVATSLGGISALKLLKLLLLAIREGSWSNEGATAIPASSAVESPPQNPNESEEV